MVGDWVAVVIVDVGDGVFYDDGFVLFGDDFVVVVGGIVEMNDVVYVSGFCGVMLFKGVLVVVCFGLCSFGGFIWWVDYDDVGYVV